MSFVMKIRVTHNNMKISENRDSFLNNEKGAGLDFLQQKLISMSPNIPQDNGNFFHWRFEKLTICFLIL